MPTCLMLLRRSRLAAIVALATLVRVRPARAGLLGRPRWQANFHPHSIAKLAQ